MQTVTMDEARAQLPELLEAAAKGEPFLIHQEGLADLTVLAFNRDEALPVPSQSASASELSPAERKVARVQDRRLGTLQGLITIPEDFDTMFADEIREMFEGDGKL